jgi:hypothetical protein
MPTPGSTSSTKPVATTPKAIDYSRKRWSALTRFLDDGRLCMSNNAAERTLRCVAVGRHNWTFAGSDEGGKAGRRDLHADRDLLMPRAA